MPKKLTRQQIKDSFDETFSKYLGKEEWETFLYLACALTKSDKRQYILQKIPDEISRKRKIQKLSLKLQNYEYHYGLIKNEPAKKVFQSIKDFILIPRKVIKIFWWEDIEP